MDEILQKLQDDNQNGSDCLSQFIQHWRDLSDAERKAIDELDELRSKLLSKETEIRLLHADINMLSADRDNRIVDVEGLSAQVRRLREENDKALSTIQNIESELEDMKCKNSQLTEELLKKAEYVSNKEMEKLKHDKALIDDKIKELEIQVKKLEKERDDLIEEHEAIEIEREEEMRALQNALDDALEQKIKIQTKYDKDFQALRSTCSAQEQQLMDDFEWKLRQVEQSWKKKIQEKERQSDEKIKDLRNILEKELVGEKDKIEAERIQVDQQMRQVSHLKSYEAEVVQLRGLTHEQQRALRAAARQIEHLKFSEKVCHDELCTVRTLLDKQKAHLQVVQGTHQRRLEAQEENIQSTLDKQRNELNAKWEDRMRGECSRLKQDLCKLHVEEKHLAVESMKLQKEQALSSARQVWERQRKDLLHEISKLKDTITEKESSCHREMEKLTTQADRETWELRRILEKTSNNHSDQISRLEDKHALEIENLQKRYDELVEKLTEVQATLKESQEKLKQKSQQEESFLNGRLGVLIPNSTVVNKSDSGCGDETTDSEKEDDEDASASEECSENEDDDDNDDAVPSCSTIGGTDSQPSMKKLEKSKTEGVEEEEDEVVSSLREEVANLQGSIEKLTSKLITPPAEPSSSTHLNPTASPNSVLSSMSDETSSETSSEVAEQKQIPSFLLICAAPVASYFLFHSILVLLWTFLVLIVLRLRLFQSQA